MASGTRARWRGRLAAARRALEALGRVPALERELADLRGRLEPADPAGSVTATPQMLERMLALERWLSRHRPPPTLVSVVLPTFDRTDMLAEAVASVQAQDHAAWELIVVDDGGMEGTRRLIESLDDPRIRSAAGGGVGPSAARNRGLDAARGELVAYLDDDNLMLPGWLAAVAWAFDRHPDVDVLYGARVVEDARMYASSSRLPRVLMSEFDRVRLKRENYTDANVLAHRAGVAGARWNAELSGVADWDLLFRLTERKPALALPALAILYRTNAPGKYSTSARFRENYATLLERLSADPS